MAFTQSDQIGHLRATADQLVATAQHASVHGVSGSPMCAAGIVAATALIVARWAPAPTRRANPAQGTTPADAVQDLQQVVAEAVANAVEHAYAVPTEAAR